jgi:hypothetical protein
MYIEGRDISNERCQECVIDKEREREVNKE